MVGARGVADSIRERYYVTAVNGRRGHIVFATDNALESGDIAPDLSRLVDVSPRDYTLERRGTFDNRNDEWIIRLNGGDA